MICRYCRESLDRTQPMATLTAWGKAVEPVHLRCGRLWIAELRRDRDELLSELTVLNRDVRSLVIHAPADPDGLELRDGAIVAGWAV